MFSLFSPISALKAFRHAITSSFKMYCICRTPKYYYHLDCNSGETLLECALACGSKHFIAKFLLSQAKLRVWRVRDCRPSIEFSQKLLFYFFARISSRFGDFMWRLSATRILSLGGNRSNKHEQRNVANGKLLCRHSSVERCRNRDGGSH